MIFLQHGVEKLTTVRFIQQAIDSKSF